jgi:hypothetical protein
MPLQAGSEIPLPADAVTPSGCGIACQGWPACNPVLTTPACGSAGHYSARVDKKKCSTLACGFCCRSIERESPLSIHLADWHISRGERMDFVLQKSTELGVQTITPHYFVGARKSNYRKIACRKKWSSGKKLLSVHVNRVGARVCRY